MIATDTYYICLSAGGILFGGLELRKPGVQQSAMVLQGQINEAGCRCAEIDNTIYWALNADHFIFFGLLLRFILYDETVGFISNPLRL